MNKEQLQKLLNQRYDAANWNKIYGSIFPNVTLFTSPKEIKVPESWVKSFRQRGLVRLQGNLEVVIFEVVLQDGISIQSKRVGLRNLVARLIDEYQNHGVLAVFDNGSPEYRFTFAAKETKVTKDGIEKTETDSKRFTYILGETETCKTAAEQFIKLSEKGSSVSLADLQEAFSVEKLSKQFFNEYKEQYNHFVSYLADQPKFLKEVFSDDEKKMRDFVKLLLGRLVFLQFVQKKKWLGVSKKNKDWTTGDVNFLVNTYRAFGNREMYYSEFLEELFFGCLNNPNRKDELFSITNTKVPFLNGGLFESDNPKTKTINFPVSYFDGLFEFFGRYNFTIDENDPTEKEVGIDPEMLGSIFENLLEDNKDKGAFYTPKEIVHYMCQESLIEYLCTKVNPENDEKVTGSIRNLITNRKIDNGVTGLIKPIAIALREVKICDPAIGSGAFPMGMLMEIFHCVFELYNADADSVSEFWSMNGWQPSVVKSNIIQNSIYGVDIEKGAVDIARLRFWLSLIVDEEEPKALPNLDYKIVVGNSLISKLGDDIIDIDWEVKPTADAAKKLQQETQNNLKKLFNTQKLFFDFNGKKENLKAEIRNLKIDVLISQLELDKYKYGESTIYTGSLFELTAKENAANQEQKQRLSRFDNTIRELQRLKSNPDLPLNFFDWKLDFPEVLNDSINNTPGFDIVVGNPPYGANIDDLVSYFEMKFPRTTKGFKDIYKLFYNQGIEYLLKKSGVLSYITPNTFLLQPRYKDLRQYFLDFRIVSILNLGEKVFEEVTVPTVLFFIKKDNASETLKFADISQGSKYTGSISDVVFKDVHQELYQSSPNKLFTDIYRVLSDDEDILDNILEMKDGGFKYQRINVGLSQKGNNDLAERLFYVGKPKGKSDIKILIGKDINSKGFAFSNREERYLIYNYELILKNNEKVYYNKELMQAPLKIVWRQTAPYFIGCVLEGNTWFGNTIQGGFIKINYINKIEPYYLLSLLNSNFIRHQYTNAVKETGRVFPQVKLEKLRPLPIKIIGIAQQNQFTEICKKIENRLKQNNDADINELLILLNSKVYRLYELSYAEVKVIDPGFELSKQDYDKIQLD
jgi:adenine-specific DNA-methyltransferase